MKDREVSLQTEDLFNLKPTIDRQVFDFIKKHKRTTQTLVSQQCKISPYSAKAHLDKLVRDGLAKDLGFFNIKKKNVKVYEIV